MTTRPLPIVACLVAVVCPGACARGEAPPEAPPPQPAPPSSAPAAATTAAPAPKQTSPSEPSLRRLPLEAVAPSAAPEPMPSVEITAPERAQRIEPGRAADFELQLNVSGGWGGGSGGEVQLALDTFRPRLRSTLPTPVRLGDLVPADRRLQPGGHVLVASLVFSSGELVRAEGAASSQSAFVVPFSVGDAPLGQVDVTRPMLLYSQPRGTYNGEQAARNVLVDFLLLGARVGPDEHRVQVHVRGQGAQARATVSAWTPLRLPELDSGDYEIRLQLLRAGGQPVPGPYGSASRWITVNRDAPVDDEVATQP